MGLPDIGLSGLSPFTARLEGGWRADRETKTYRQREWRGTLRSDQAFVAVVLAGRDDGLSWCRTRWPAAAEHELTFTYSSHGPARQYFNAYLSIGTAIVQTHGEMADAESSMVAIASGTVHGAGIQVISRLAPEARAVFGVWLVAAQDARSARNHTWHLRSPLPEDSDSRAARIFGGRRNGAMSV
jgi:hypothetical protein